jgi:UDP-N-acetylmuramoyl-tripeptide--D-alanyl-D-alanine ligase
VTPNVNGPFAWTDEQVRSALDVAPQEDCSRIFTGISIDSRTTREGNLFVALSGDNFDGHDYVSDALGRGAWGAVVARSVEAAGACIYPVEDTLLALGQLAGHRRRSLDAVVVGITGSSGKTGTKELTRAAIEQSRRVHATPENLNNRIGLPLTLLDAPDDAEVVVLEMGTNEPGEIAALTRIAEPQIGVVTTVSETHIEKLESLDGVLEEKLDLLRGLPEDGNAVVGDEPPILSERAGRIRQDVLVVGLGAGADAEYRPSELSMDEQGCWSFVWRGEPVHLRVPGRHSVQNALLALTVAELLDVPAAEATRGVGSVEPGPMRGEIKKIGGLTLILDCYNANPQSLRAALDLLVDIEPGRPKVAVLGSMLELGGRSDELHAALLREASELGLDLIVATGEFARAAADGSTILSVVDPLEAYERLREGLAGDEVLLMKASRGVALERLLPLLEEDFGGSAPRSRPGGSGQRSSAGGSTVDSGGVEA